ncbi:methyltransferase domain-containing protein [Bailinhaonella thermotolerans]|uniref:Methyltransferase domain-containing protein n=1 Tax=Bailinhaonella thermotolerans TaxID=1070861 RepID=A0A3A4B115_9ACTN|nr:methyltransferase domain-containing protein [Bailinhaonella thermotolerans]RJL31727.1 methyltransferase domain-containing protein [Bailinhaonella thermotolerans]
MPGHPEHVGVPSPPEHGATGEHEIPLEERTPVDPIERFIGYLDRIEWAPQAVRLRRLSYDLLAEGPAGLTLDAGSGGGCAVAELTEQGQQAVGIDVAERMIEIARRRFPHCEYRIAAVEGLPYDDHTLARYRAEGVYQHLANPEVALAEARRALVPGGRIVLLDQDHDMWGLDADDVQLTRVITRGYTGAIAQPWIGRRYRDLLTRAGFVNVAVDIHPMVYTDIEHTGAMLPRLAEAAVKRGAIRPAQAKAWLAEQEERDVDGRFYLVMPMFVASANTPTTP